MSLVDADRVKAKADDIIPDYRILETEMAMYEINNEYGICMFDLFFEEEEQVRIILARWKGLFSDTVVEIAKVMDELSIDSGPCSTEGYTRTWRHVRRSINGMKAIVKSFLHRFTRQQAARSITIHLYHIADSLREFEMTQLCAHDDLSVLESLLVLKIVVERITKVWCKIQSLRNELIR